MVLPCKITLIHPYTHELRDVVFWLYTDLPIRDNKQDSERGQNRQRKDTGKRIGKNEAVDL